MVRTSASVPKGRVFCESMLPQKTRSLPNSRLRKAGSMPAAVTWTGLMICTPVSTRSGRMETIEPQEWNMSLAGVSSRTRRKNFACRGLKPWRR